MKKILGAVVAFGLSISGASAATIHAEFWDASRSFSTVDQAIAYTKSNAVTATFESTAIDYPNRGVSVRSGRTSLADFIGTDAATILGNGSARLGTSVFKFSGRLDLVAGEYEISVGSDDGFRLFFNGINVAEQVRPRPFRLTTLPVTVTGTSDFELYYYENFGNTGVEFRIDGGIVDTTFLAPIPLPASFPLLVLALGGLGLVARRRNKA